MAFDMAAQKIKNRQAIHDRLAVSAVYRDDTVTIPAEEGLTVRWGNRLVRAGSGDMGADVDILESVNRLIFNQPQLDALGLTLQAQAVVTLVKFGMDFCLEAREDSDGPVSVYWMVSRVRP